MPRFNTGIGVCKQSRRAGLKLGGCWQFGKPGWEPRSIEVNPRRFAGFKVVSVASQLDRGPTAYMKWLAHDLLEGEHDNIPP